MTQSSRPEFVQSLIVLAHARKERLSAALDDARRSLEQTPRTYAATAHDQHARTHAERLDLIIQSR